jgi:hypothetical protein
MKLKLKQLYHQSSRLSPLMSPFVTINVTNPTADEVCSELIKYYKYL